MIDLLPEMLEPELLRSLARAAAILVAGLLFARVAGSLVGRATSRLQNKERTILARRAATYLVGLLAVAEALRELGFDLSVLLGAAGVLSVAIGFASQTSASNLISGLFLVAERPFSVGDAVQIGGTTGEVIAIDLLSTKLRTFDNLYVRVPNESVMKAEIKNLSRFPIRRFDFELVLDAGVPLASAKAILDTVAFADMHVLAEPAPRMDFVAVEEGNVRYAYRIWSARENYADTRTRFAAAALSALREGDIDLAAPARSAR
jgi:small-conductance mechanosensitive channel